MLCKCGLEHAPHEPEAKTALGSVKHAPPNASVLVTVRGPEKMWGIFHQKATFSPHTINILPKFWQQNPRPHKLSTNYPLLTNIFPKNPTFLNNLSSFSPLSNQNSLFGPTSCQCTGSLWEECGDYIDMGKTWGKCWRRSFPSSPSKQLPCGENVGKCWCGQILGKMLT